jgi:uncharacterized membrane-anchored protein YhcB (DUF1043 family)
VQQKQIMIGLIIGLIIGAGVGYFSSPSDTSNIAELENQIITLENQIALLDSQKSRLETQLSDAQNNLTTSTDELEELTSSYNSLKHDYDELKATILNPQIKKGEWNKTYSCNGTGTYTTDYFSVPEIQDVELRISWTNYASNSKDWIFSIQIFKKGDELQYNAYILPTLKEGYWLIHSPIPTGETYIRIDTLLATDSRWNILVEAWIPE